MMGNGAHDGSDKRTPQNLGKRWIQGVTVSLPKIEHSQSDVNLSMAPLQDSVAIILK